MGKILDTQSYENLFRFNLEMNEKLLASSDFCNEITHLIVEYFSYRNSLIILSDDKFINIYDNVNLKKIYSQEYIDKDVKNDYILINKELLNHHDPETYCGEILYLEDIIPFADYERTDFYNNFFKNRDIFYEAIIFLDETTSSLSLYKSKADGNFTENERLLISYIANSVRQGYQLYLKINRLDSDIRLLKESYNLSALGNIIINKDKEIIDYNTTSVEFCKAITDEINTDRALGRFISGLEKSTNFQATAEQTISYYVPDFKIEINTFINKTVYDTFEKNHLITIARSYTQKDPGAFMVKYSITTREQQIIDCIARGLRNQEIADELCISIHTVKAHIKNIFTKLGVNSQIAVIAKLNEYI